MRNKDIAIASIVTASIAGAVAARSVAAQQPANPRQQPGNDHRLVPTRENLAHHISVPIGQRLTDSKRSNPNTSA